MKFVKMNLQFLLQTISSVVKKRKLLDERSKIYQKSIKKLSKKITNKKLLQYTKCCIKENNDNY